jgi:diguanylate cyclase
MQVSRAIAESTADAAHQVVEIMRRMGVAGLPRNYEIFYEAHAGSNEKLKKALSALGERPDQAAIDKLARDYFAATNRDAIVETAHESIMYKIEEVMDLLHREKNSLEKYGVILDKTSAGLNGKQNLTTDLLRKIVGIMAIATDTTIEQGRQIASSISDTSAELAEVKSMLVEYKTLADTDPLTQIWNRRAFDRAMARIYEHNKGIIFNALILADIDRFKDINDRFGHPFGDRVLQHVAQIMKAAVSANMTVARTGGEEFAIIVEGLTEDATVALADTVRGHIERTPFLTADGQGARDRVTVSMGVCMASEAGGPQDLYEKADQALYVSKTNGRNKVTRYPVAGPVKQRKNWMLYRTE